MDKKKKVFLAMAIIFLLIVFFIVYDMGRRTSFPWQQNQPAGQEQLNERE